MKEVHIPPKQLLICKLIMSNNMLKFSVQNFIEAEWPGPGLKSVQISGYVTIMLLECNANLRSARNLHRHIWLLNNTVNAFDMRYMYWKNCFCRGRKPQKWEIPTKINRTSCHESASVGLAPKQHSHCLCRHLAQRHCTAGTDVAQLRQTAEQFLCI
jgi:hypothetical protein